MRCNDAINAETPNRSRSQKSKSRSVAAVGKKSKYVRCCTHDSPFGEKYCARSSSGLRSIMVNFCIFLNFFEYQYGISNLKLNFEFVLGDL
jgi:hypothetical protein